MAAKVAIDRADRERLLMLIEKLLADPRVQAVKPSAEQMAMLDRIRTVLHERPTGARRLAAVKHK